MKNGQIQPVSNFCMRLFNPTVHITFRLYIRYWFLTSIYLPNRAMPRLQPPERYTAYSMLTTGASMTHVVRTFNVSQTIINRLSLGFQPLEVLMMPGF